MSYMRSAERQRQILDCAKRVFARRGYHAANISHICREAGIGRGTLYQYFTSKKDVFAAIVRQTLLRVRAGLEARAPNEFPPPETLSTEQVVAWSARKLRNVLAIVFDDEAMLRLILREAVGLDVDIEELLSEIDDGIIRLVERDLVAAQETGYVRTNLDARVAATLIVGGVEKLALAALRSDAPVNLDELALEASRFHNTGALSERVWREPRS